QLTPGLSRGSHSGAQTLQGNLQRLDSGAKGKSWIKKSFTIGIQGCVTPLKYLRFISMARRVAHILSPRAPGGGKCFD
ncbi:MAG: hypothetical protein ABI395_03855, partial [Sphingobium sp.]